MPSAPFKPGWFHTATTVNGRAGASTKTKVKYLAKPGHNFRAVQVVQGDGRAWLVSDKGTYYAAEFCTSGKATSPSRINPVAGRAVTTPWGKKPPYRNGRPRYWTTRLRHTGSDRAAPQGAAVTAMVGGTVHRRWDKVLGNVALLYTRDKKGRKVTFWFCHLSSLTKTGKVKAGQRIGRVGSTGTGALGPHLHLEVRLGWTTSWAGRDYNPELSW